MNLILIYFSAASGIYIWAWSSQKLETVRAIVSRNSFSHTIWHAISHPFVCIWSWCVSFVPYWTCCWANIDVDERQCYGEKSHAELAEKKKNRNRRVASWQRNRTKIREYFSSWWRCLWFCLFVLYKGSAAVIVLQIDDFIFFDWC